MAEQDNKTEPTEKPQEVTLDQSARDLILDQKKAEARKAIAEARKAELAALQPQLPDLKVDIPEEKLDAGEKGSPLSEILAYAELDDAADTILDRVKVDLDTPGLDGARVLLVRTPNLEVDHGAYITFMSYQARLKAGLQSALQRLEKPEQPQTFGVFPLPGAIGLALSGLPTVLSLLRQNTTIRGRDFTVSANAVTAAIAQKLRASHAEVLVAGFAPVPQNDVFELIKALQGDRDELADLQARWRLEEVEPRTVELAGQTERLKGLYQERTQKIAAEPPQATDGVDQEIQAVRETAGGLEARVAGAKFNVDTAQRLIDAVDTFVTTIHTAAKSGVPPIVTAAVWHEFFAHKDNRYVMFAEAAFGGGESRYDERIGRDRAQHLGGVSLSYLLTDHSGLIKSSGVVSRLGFATHKIGDVDIQRGRSQLLQ